MRTLKEVPEHVAKKTVVDKVVCDMCGDKIGFLNETNVGKVILKTNES